MRGLAPDDTGPLTRIDDPRADFPDGSREFESLVRYIAEVGWRRECQSILIDVKLFFIPARGNLRSWLPAIGPSRAPAPPQASASSSVDPGQLPPAWPSPLRRRRSEDAEGADRGQRLLEELRAALLNGHSRGGLRRSASSRMPCEERPASCSSKLAHR